MTNRKYFDSIMELVLEIALVRKDTGFATNNLLYMSFGMSWQELEVHLENHLTENTVQYAVSFAASHCGH